MSGHDGQPGVSREPEVPEALARELRAVYRGGQGEWATPRMDEVVLGLARERAAAAARGRKRLQLAGWAAAAAAAVIVGVSVLYVRPWAPAPLGPGAVAAGGMDVNGDGRVDILDALVLARAVEGGGGVDVNGDGAADGADVGAVAAAAVLLEGRG